MHIVGNIFSKEFEGGNIFSKEFEGGWAVKSWLRQWVVVDLVSSLVIF